MCIFIENGLRKALRTYNFKKKSVFVCTFRADQGKIGQNARINSKKKRFSYVRLLRPWCRIRTPPAVNKTASPPRRPPEPIML